MIRKIYKLFFKSERGFTPLEISNSSATVRTKCKNIPAGPYSRQKFLTGFTIFEIIVSISLFVVIILLTGSMYLVSQRSYNKSSDEAELSQNARVALDRISRELRQTSSVITPLPPTDHETVPPATEILFQDGHDTSKITYIKYYLDNNNLMRRHIAYSFNAEPAIYVVYGSHDINGDPADETDLDDPPRTVGEYFNNLRFWGSNKLVHISMGLIKNQNKLNADTKVYTRN